MVPSGSLDPVPLKVAVRLVLVEVNAAVGGVFGGGAPVPAA